MLLKADLMQVFMNAAVLFSSYLFGGGIPPSFFLLPSFMGAIFLRIDWEKKEMVIMGRVSSSSGLPGGEVTPESCLKIQIP